MPALLIAVALAATAPAARTELPPPPPQHAPASRFKCQDGGDLNAEFESRRAGLVAIVDAGDGPHALPLRPWDGGEPRIIWSDGTRTLTWSPGVNLMWMDGASHRMCGRAEHRH